MNQNDYVALGLSALVVGGLAVFGRQLGGKQPEPMEPNPRPPGVLPNLPPLPVPPPPPGSDPQYDAARRAIDTLVLALQVQGGGVTQLQRDQAAQTLDAQALRLEATGQSPAAVALLRQASQQLRSGQLPSVPPSVNPAPSGPSFPPFFTPTPSTGESAPVSPSAPSDDLMARYKECREHCADFLQGAREMDLGTLGAADRTSTDLLRAGDELRALDLGALATASYARAGITRPVPVTA